MKLKTVEIKNFRCFESLSIDFDEQLTVFVGENGAGKTTILDAIAVAISPFVGGFDTGISKGFKPEDARLVSDFKLTDDNSFLIELSPRYSTMEPQYSISLMATGIINGQFEPWSRELTGAKTQTTFGKAKVLIDYAKTLQQQVREREPVTLPIVAYYGTGRLLKQSNTSKKSSTESRSRLYGYHDALNPNADYKSFEKWFIETSIAEYINESKARIAEYINESKARNELYRATQELLQKEGILSANDSFGLPVEASYNPVERPFPSQTKYVQQAVNKCLSISKWHSLEYEPNLRTLILSNENKTFMPVPLLSDGVKAMLTLIADIAYRCVQLNPHLASPCEETNGIVLIDEIDLHLHAKWQQTVLSDLQKAFPCIQFIVTTHSPQVLSTVPSHQIRILLDERQIYLAEAGTQGAESSRILKRIFGVDPRPQHDPNTQLLNEYLDLVYADKWNEAKEQREKLDAIYQGNEPALTEADLYIENRQWELNLEENQ